jgi:hypothetical protein
MDLTVSVDHAVHGAPFNRRVMGPDQHADSCGVESADGIEVDDHLIGEIHDD